jgi:hypothetical protein
MNLNAIFYFTFINCLFSVTAFSQHIDTVNTNKIITRNYFALIPNNVNKINGLAIGAWAANLKNDTDTLQNLEINGCNIEINPILFFIYIRGYGFAIPQINNDSLYKQNKLERFTTKIKGFNCSILGYANHTGQITGLSITPLTMLVGELNGVSISGLTNSAYNFNGVSICGIYNSVYKMKGLQIGLFNKAVHLKGIQIGLWNKNKKRSLPFINWQF